MRNDLDRPAEEIAAPFFADDLRVHLSAREVGRAAEADVNESFVVTQVEVRFRAVVEDVHLSVLVRTHRARVHVDIRIQFLNRHLEPALPQKQARRRRSHAFAHRRNNPASEK